MKEYYKVPTAQHRKNALGSLPGLSYAVKKSLEQVLPFSQPMKKPKEGEWLWEHQQQGQTFDAYKGQMHNQVDKKRNTIYIKPLQQMSKQFIQILKEYCQAFFYPMPVKVLKVSSLQKVKKRINQYTQKPQFNARDILNQRKHKIKADGFCQLAICMTDLYPKQQWNFVFGLASIRQRIGVFSFARYDERFFQDKKYQIDYDKILWSSISVMVHEITHMFGIRHCIYYNCLMNGSNHLQESKSRPMQLCVVCLRKLQSNIQFDILERYKKIQQFVKKYGDGSGKKLGVFLEEVIVNIQKVIKK